MQYILLLLLKTSYGRVYLCASSRKGEPFCTRKGGPKNKACIIMAISIKERISKLKWEII